MVRLQADHVNRTLIPGFYRFLQAQETEAQISAGKEFHQAIGTLVGLFERAEREILNGDGVPGEGEKQALNQGLGLWVNERELGWTDVMVAPCTLPPCTELTSAHTRAHVRHFVKGCTARKWC